MANKINLIENLDDSYIMLGIVTTNTDYQLAHFINKAIDVNFSKYNDFEFNTCGRPSCFYSWYFCRCDELKIKAYLIENRHPEKKLISKHKQFDFFMILENSDAFDNINQLTTRLREIRNVTAVLSIKLSDIKNINLLLEENEMHELNYVKP